MKRIKVVHLAGYVRGENNWDIVGGGDTIEAARAQLKEKVDALDPFEREHGLSKRYVETSYTCYVEDKE